MLLKQPSFENQRRAIQGQVLADRTANGGKLTAREKAQINKEQTQAAQSVYNKKHNARSPLQRSRERKGNRSKAPENGLPFLFSSPAQCGKFTAEPSQRQADHIEITSVNARYEAACNPLNRVGARLAERLARGQVFHDVLIR